MHCHDDEQERDVDLPRRAVFARVGERDPFARARSRFVDVAAACALACRVRRRAYATAVVVSVTIDDYRRARSPTSESRARPGSGARRAARARAVRARRGRRARATPRRCASRATADEVAAAVRVAARHGRPFVARGSGTGLAGGATPVDDPVVIVTTQMNRVLEVDADAAGRVGRARRAQPRPQPRGRAPRPALRARPVVAAGVHDRRQRRHQRRRAALPRRRASPPRTCSRSRWCWPTARSRMLGGLEPDQPGYDLRGCFVGSEGTMGIATADRGAAHARTRRRCARCCSTSPSIEDAAATVSGDHRRRDRARRARDDGRRRSRARSRTTSAPATRATPPRCCSSRSTASPAASTAQVDAVVARSAASTARARCASRPTTPSARCSGRGASRRSARSPASRPTTTCTTRSCPRTKLVEVLRQVYEIAAEHELTMMNVFHAGDGNLHPLHRVRRARAGRVGARARGRRRDPRRVRRRRRRALGRARHRAREARLDAAACSRPTTSTRRPACATRSIPTARANPQKVLPRGQPVRRAASACPEGAWI